MFQRAYPQYTPADAEYVFPNEPFIQLDTETLKFDDVASDYVINDTALVSQDHDAS